MNSQQPFQLPLLDLREELKRYRMKRELSQHDVARRIATTQVTISRYENGGSVSEEIVGRVRQLLIQELKRAGGFSYSADFNKIEHWQFGVFKFPMENSGDSVRLLTSAQGPQIPLMMCDATGSDITAAKTAELLEVAFAASVGALGNLYITPETLFRGIDNSIRQNRPIWGDAPSVLIGLLERNSGGVYLLNAGMPNGFMYRGKDGTIAVAAEHKVSPPGMQKLAQVSLQHDFYRLEEDDLLFLCSDGFKSEIERRTSYKLDVQLQSVARALKSNIKGVGMKLLRTLEVNGNPVSAQDNMSFFIIGPR